MKIRQDYVTNSSSSSYIVCFARIADESKAAKVLNEFSSNIEVYTAEEALASIEHGEGRWRNWLECDWAGVDITPSKDYIREHMDARFVVHSHCEDLYEDEDGEVDYYVDYSDFDTKAIDAITEENGFADIQCDYGAGRNG